MQPRYQMEGMGATAVCIILPFDTLLADVTDSGQEITQSLGIPRIAVEKDANDDPAGGPELYNDAC